MQALILGANDYVPKPGDGRGVEEVIEEDKFVSKDLKPAPVEGTIEKYVRVLELANNDDIEVRPSDPVYPLL